MTVKRTLVGWLLLFVCLACTGVSAQQKGVDRAEQKSDESQSLLAQATKPYHQWPLERVQRDPRLGKISPKDVLACFQKWWGQRRKPGGDGRKVMEDYINWAKSTEVILFLMRQYPSEEYVKPVKKMMSWKHTPRDMEASAIVTLAAIPEGRNYVRSLLKDKEEFTVAVALDALCMTEGPEALEKLLHRFEEPQDKGVFMAAAVRKLRRIMRFKQQVQEAETVRQRADLLLDRLGTGVLGCYAWNELKKAYAEEAEATAAVVRRARKDRIEYVRKVGADPQVGEAAVVWNVSVARHKYAVILWGLGAPLKDSEKKALGKWGPSAPKP